MTFFYQICVWYQPPVCEWACISFCIGKTEFFFTFLDLGHRGHSVGKRTRICVFPEVTINTIIKRPTNDHLWRDFSGLDQEASSLSKSFRGHYLISNSKIHRETTNAELSGFRFFLYCKFLKFRLLGKKMSRVRPDSGFRVIFMFSGKFLTGRVIDSSLGWATEIFRYWVGQKR